MQAGQQESSGASGEGLQEPLLSGEEPTHRVPSLTLSPKRGGRPGSSSDGPDTPQLRSAPLASPFSTGTRPGQASNAQSGNNSDEDVQTTPSRAQSGTSRPTTLTWIPLQSMAQGLCLGPSMEAPRFPQGALHEIQGARKLEPPTSSPATPSEHVPSAHLSSALKHFAG